MIKREREYYHVYPTNDLRDHDIDAGPDCWCRPRVVDETIIVHNALDQRERREERGKDDA